MNERPRNPGQMAFLVFAIFMSVVYIALGMVLFLNRPAVNLMSDLGYQKLFGALIMAYGAFRGYRAWVDFKGRTRGFQ